jgi:hypothetical protein
MKSRYLCAAAILIALSIPASAAAQQHRFDIGVLGGWSWLTPALDQDHLGSNAELEFESGFLLGAQAGVWFSPRIGLRANFGFADRALVFDGDENLLDDEDSEILPHVNLWNGTGDLLIRFANTPAMDYAGPEFLPFLALGLGAKWVNAAGGGNTIQDADGDPDTGVIFGVGGDNYFMQDQATLLGRVGLGTDLRVSRNLAFRLEVGDMMWDAPFERVEQRNGQFVRVDPDGEDIGKTQHELYGTAGIHLLLGLGPRTEVAMAEPAPPPPPAEPAPPPPPPAEESVTVCVIDPATGVAGMRTLTAFYRPTEGDTLVDEAGNRVPLSGFGTNLRVATDEDWYVRGLPLTIEYGNVRQQYTPYGRAQVMADHDLVVLGTVNGLPIYANADDAAAFRAAAGDELIADGDLPALLIAQPEARDEFNEITMLYIPTRAIGCEFGPLQRMEDIRKR